MLDKAFRFFLHQVFNFIQNCFCSTARKFFAFNQLFLDNHFSIILLSKSHKSVQRANCNVFFVLLISIDCSFDSFIHLIVKCIIHSCNDITTSINIVIEYVIMKYFYNKHLRLSLFFRIFFLLKSNILVTEVRDRTKHGKG